jgi:hypothetical protein
VESRSGHGSVDEEAPVVSLAKRPDGRWRARYRDAADKEHSRYRVLAMGLAASSVPFALLPAG